MWRSGRLVARLDVASEELLYASEYDGAEWHASPEQQAHDEGRRCELDQEFDWLVQGFTKVEVFGQRRKFHDMLMAGAREARERRGRRIA